MWLMLPLLKKFVWALDQSSSQRHFLRRRPLVVQDLNLQPAPFVASCYKVCMTLQHVCASDDSISYRTWLFYGAAHSIVGLKGDLGSTFGERVPRIIH